MSRHDLSDLEKGIEGPLQYEVEHLPAFSVPTTCLGFAVGCQSDHKKFIPANEVALSNLPEEIRNEDVLKMIELNRDLAVHVGVRRPAQQNGNAMWPQEASVENETLNTDDNGDRSGSGSICYFSDTHNLYPCCHDDEDVDKCPRCHIPGCPYLESLGHDHYMVTNYGSNLSDEKMARAHLAFRVSTNQHVVKDETDARNSTISLFYHTDDRRGVVEARGVCLCEKWEEQDKVHIVCVADMNPRLRSLLENMRRNFYAIYSAIPENVKQTFIEKYVVVASHPHGTPKVISVGSKIASQQKKCHNGRCYTETRYQVETCLGSSGAPVIGPGWEDGSPVYRVHCGFLNKNDRKIGLSKSFWIVGSDPRGGAGPMHEEPTYTSALGTVCSAFLCCGFCVRQRRRHSQCIKTLT